MANHDETDEHDRVTTAISRVLAPVIICMVFAIWLVHSLGDHCEQPPVATPQGSKPLPAFRPPKEQVRTGLPPRGTPLRFGRTNAIVFVCIFVVLIVVFTYLLVFLFKRGHQRFIAGWIFMAVFLIFAYVGGIYLFEFTRSHCIPLDWVTLAFAVWNFTITGLLAIFGKVPRFINQAYLIVMSALMAYVFRTLPSWATWVILSVLVVWDLFAVLTPFGPLKALVKHARERGEQLPALVYDTNPVDVGREPEAMPAISLKTKANKKRSNRAPTTDAPEEGAQRRARRLRRRRKDDDVEKNADEAFVTVEPEPEQPAAPPPAALEREAPEQEARTEREPNVEPELNAKMTSPTPEQKKKALGTLGSHLKLGLGDFVFYSILVALASQDGAMTTLTSFVAILAGLCITLFLVLVYRMALPALPISIVFGIVFFFLTKHTVEPYVQTLFDMAAFH